MIENPKLEFCRRFVYLNRKRIDFQGRAYLEEIFASRARNIVLRCSRQTEKSTHLALCAIYQATVHRGSSILFCAPRREQASLWVASRFLPMVEDSPVLSRVLLGNSRRRPPIFNMQFANGSRLYARGAYNSADAARGISCDTVILDEYQDMQADDLPVLLETQSHSTRPRIIVAGTPKLIDGSLEILYNQSSANEWVLICDGCGGHVILDERCLAPSGVACPQCQTLLDVRKGCWVPRNPNATWGAGFWICHPMTPWNSHAGLLERKRVYDLARFRNECLGLPVHLGEHAVTREELAACCTDRPMAESIEDIPQKYREYLVCGVDWGGGGTSRTAMTIGYMREDFVFEVVYFGRFSANEDPTRVLKLVASVCRNFGVRIIGADGGGNGNVYNALLADPLQPPYVLYGILYSASGQRPHQEGLQWKWTVNRSATIGDLFSRVKKQQIRFPCEEQCGSFLDEFSCVAAEYDDERRTIKYTHPATLPDDSMHACNYALVMAVQWWGIHGTQNYDGDE